MKAVDLCVFLTSYTMVVAFAAIAELFRSRRASSLVSVIVAVVAITVTTVVGFYLEPGDNYLGILWSFVGERDFSAAASLGLGAAAALVWLARLTDKPRFVRDDIRYTSTRRMIGQVILATSIMGVVLCAQAFIWKELRGYQRDQAVRVHAPGFVIDKIADLDFLPLRLATSDDGRVYVSYDYFETWGTMGGAIVELSRNDATDKFDKKIVADSTLLMRSYGLAARDGELFVSRTGICSRANHGRISYQTAGAVTQLRDVDGDGYFEFAHDIASDIPGARGPDTMQQNNGIAFALDGSLFVTTASSANRVLEDHPWAGAVLRISPDFTKTEVFAKGFRNPWGIVIGPDGELFVTDNDIDENPGDELNHVVFGAHYGHPYVVPNEPSVESEGFGDPILVGDMESNYLGIAYSNSPALPEEYRNCLYLTNFMQDTILRLKLTRTGDTYEVTSIDNFATVDSPVDIAITPSGEFFVLSRKTRNVYRIRPRDVVTRGTDG